jgi:hypothetical protein
MTISPVRNETAWGPVAEWKVLDSDRPKLTLPYPAPSGDSGPKQSFDRIVALLSHDLFRSN